MSKEKERIHPTNGEKMFAAGFASGVGALAFGVKTVSFLLEEYHGAHATIPITPIIEPSQAITASSENSQVLEGNINAWVDIKRKLGSVAQTRITMDELSLGSVAKGQLAEAATQHLIDGVYLAKLALPLEESAGIHIDQKQHKLTLLGRDLDLTNSLHFNVAASTLELLLKKQSIDQQIRVSAAQRQEDFRYDKQLLEEDIKNLLWLVDENAPIIVEKDAFAFVPTERLTRLSKLLQSLIKADMPIPRAIFYVSYYKGAPGGAWYNDHDSKKSPFTMWITPNSDADAESHEIGHFISDATNLIPDDLHLKEISQQQFEFAVMRVLSRHGKTVYDVPISKDKNKIPSLIEEYAVMFTKYYRDPEILRSEIYRASLNNSLLYDLLATEYAFMKNVWRGIEYSSEVKTFDPPGVYEMGQRVTIVDKNIEKAGFLLRPTLVSGRNSEMSAVFSGDIVEIIGYPQISKLDNKMYVKVRILQRTGENYYLLGLEYKTEGWIPLEALGETARR